MGRNKITDKIRNTFWKGGHYYGKKTRWDWNRGSCSECRSCHIYEKESTEKAKEKPEGVEEKSAYIVGSGLASLAAACFLVRDGQMPGHHIHILEAMDIAGGACDGIFDPSRGYVMRGGREMENHFECLWDLFRSIPSLEIPNASVLDEFYWLNKKDPNYSLCRATVNPVFFVFDNLSR